MTFNAPFPLFPKLKLVFFLLAISGLTLTCKSPDATSNKISLNDSWQENSTQLVSNARSASDDHKTNKQDGAIGDELSGNLTRKGVSDGNEKIEKQVETVDRIQTISDFEVQLLYEVPLEQQGSWVSLNKDPQGRLIASDQNDKGMYRITVEGDKDNPEVDVEALVMPITGAQGIVWAFDHLYANVNGEGLYRLRDNKGDDQLNVMEYLGGPKGRGEHGNHALLKTPDGEDLYFVAGNHTPPPEFTASRVANWEEDLLLPRRWDARGHARGIFAPGGYIARINPEATEWEMISMGYRNQYDAAINQHGELFTYDADMEWDLGMPWYRPTKIVHAVSGSDNGWRSGSGKWPNYFEDSTPPLLEIGPGSPTGLLFGTGASFPARYQRAMFALDWTFGTMYAIHLTPDGAGYEAEAEEFLSGSPLPLTDAVVGDDGALYFTTGGRNQQSKLYRVVYKGNKPVAPAEAKDNPDARKARELRHKLESFHGKEDPEAVNVAWPYLDNDDRLLRHAARVAIEAQPAEKWAERALNDERPQARITAMVALARTGPDDYKSEALDALLELEPSTLEPDQQLGLLRAMALVFMRLGNPEPDEKKRITNTLQQMLPNDDDRVNTELIRVLVYLRDSRVIPKALQLMQNETPPETPEWGELIKRNERYGGTIEEMIENPPPTRELNYAFMLRNLRNGWTIEQRREYFRFINESADRMGGASYSGFLADIRNDALNNATEEEIEAVADITEVSLKKEPDFEIKPPQGPGRNWTLDEAYQTVSGHLEGRDFEQGRNAFFAANCASCHRFDGYGGNIGPDLGTVGSRFNVYGLLEKIINPNVLISDQYSSSRVTLDNGEEIIGLVVDREDKLEIYKRDPNAESTVVARDKVRSVEQVDVSQMPPGLINTLNPEELRDLIAYLRSGGNEDHEMFENDQKEAKGKARGE